MILSPFKYNENYSRYRRGFYFLYIYMYDVIIIGSWSAGLPAGMYASRYKLSNLIIGELPGGALSTSHCVENYPGTLSASWAEIMENFKKHAETAGSEFLQDRVDIVSKIDDNKFEIKTMSWKVFESKRVILATGNTYKMLGIPWEKELYGQGVSYCATCDGNFYKNLVVGMVGAWNTAITEALYLAEITKEVHIFVRGDQIRAEDIWTEKAKATKNIIFHMNTQVTEVKGNMMGVESVILSNWETLKLDWLFVAIWSTPIISIVDNLKPEKDEDNYLIVDKRQETSIKGLYAAWDVTTNSNKFRQTIMSAAEWCLAANSVHEDLMRL